MSAPWPKPAANSHSRCGALAELGQVEEGIAQLRQGLDDIRATGMEVQRPYNLALLAEGYRKGGRLEERAASLTEALSLITQTGELLYEAELHHLKGELALQGREAQPEKAEASFQKALNVARQQEAKSSELRAATSLARLWQSQGKIAEARDLLALVYNWFTEGFDTADLKNAKALLDELS